MPPLPQGMEQPEHLSDDEWDIVLEIARTDLKVAEQIENNNIKGDQRYWVGYAGGPGFSAYPDSAVISGSAHPDEDSWYYPAMWFDFQKVTDRHGQLVGVALASERVVLSRPLGPVNEIPLKKGPPPATSTAPSGNSTGMAEEVKEPTETISPNSANAAGQNQNPRYLIKGLAENTYVSGEAFGIRALTDQEKADLIAIASQHPAVSEFINSGYEYLNGFQWIGVLPSGGYGLLPYDTVEKGVPTVLDWPPRATFYPAVNFHFGSFVVTLAVDPDKREVVYTTGGPIRTGPVPNPNK